MPLETSRTGKKQNGKTRRSLIIGGIDSKKSVLLYFLPLTKKA